MPTIPRIIGHRGWSARFPDNSLAGLIAASAVADGVEVDVRRSGDGKLVLSHDPSIGGLDVVSTPWSVLAEVDLGGGHHPALLDEAVASLPSTPLLLEVKNQPLSRGFEPDHRLALEVAERARPGDMVTSFNWATVDRVLEIFPETATGLIGVGDAVVEAVARCRIGHRGLIAEQHSANEIIASALESGLDVYIWTVNDPMVATELATFGVSGIITDEPDLILQTLGARR